MAKPISQLVPFMRMMGQGVITALQMTAERVKVRMAESGAPITYPVQWDNPKQKRAFFATNGFGHGIPYQRKGTYEASGVVTHTPTGSTFFKPHPAGAIGGIPSGWQSRIHRGRWNNLLAVLFDELSRLPAEISNQIRVVSA